MRRLPALLLALHTLTALALPAAADPPPRPSGLRSDILYTHKGEFVQVAPMRALTLNAHVEQFAYDPLGLELAVAGSETTGETTTHFVKTLDARTGHEMSRYAFAAPADDKIADIQLLGFSPSGKYLLLQQFVADPNEPEAARAEFVRWNLSASPPSPRTIYPQSALPPDQQSADLAGLANCYSSPNTQWLLFTQSVPTRAADGTPGPIRDAYLLYDTERDSFKTLTLPPNARSYEWADATHLMMWQGSKRNQFDVVTGAVSPPAAQPDGIPSAVSKKYPDLSLTTETRTLNDTQPTGGSANASLVWIRRTPFGKAPLGAAVAGLMPNAADGNSDSSVEPPAWSPTGSQIAFIANSELYVTNLLPPSGPMPSEKLAVGLKLSCEDERMLAISNLKQIGLGIIQYTQDADEVYPPAAGWAKAIMPYVRTNDLFAVDGHAVVYEEPPGHTLASVDEPAVTENAYIDLPCARVALFCDGHVKVFAK